ncbi:hypothetical protein [Chitinasiproducens palmae]|uniref:Uncharacterized protein n=1 Tax=Chitinasiproducens palmae TaxID=1770053 RepID=A0A1H2PQ29_9BURK|nr:hypothetical protein [Chitinasiproducens palmae]SDV48884.1 hypothetical protein SAMN05216551_106140 [Chitinasiproducens palmae]
MSPPLDPFSKPRFAHWSDAFLVVNDSEQICLPTNRPADAGAALRQ